MKKRALFILLTALTLIFSLPLSAADKRFVLVIDAGHGGHDTGCIGKISKEKNLALRYALAFGQKVERECPDVKVIYTRKSDIFLGLAQRAEIANKNKADLFISIHINALESGRIARGVETFTLGKSRRNGNVKGVEMNLEVAKRENSVIFLEKNHQQIYQGFDPNSAESNIMFEFIQDKNMEQSVELAKYMQANVCAATGRNNMGAHQDNLAVLRLSSMPGCLLELGFISTPDEEEFLNSEEALPLYVKGIFKAFMQYKKRYGNNSITVPYQPQNDEPAVPQIVPEKYKEQAAAKEVEKKSQKSEKKSKRAEKQSQPAPTKLAETAPKKQETQAKKQENVAPKTQTVAPQPKVTEKPVPADAPVFKVQILANSRKLRSDDAHFKGHTNYAYYEENNMIKYTIGESTNYNTINKLRKELLADFPECFIIAFKNGSKMDVNAAIREFLNNKKK